MLSKYLYKKCVLKYQLQKSKCLAHSKNSEPCSFEIKRRDDKTRTIYGVNTNYQCNNYSWYCSQRESKIKYLLDNQPSIVLNKSEGDFIDIFYNNEKINILKIGKNGEYYITFNLLDYFNEITIFGSDKLISMYTHSLCFLSIISCFYILYTQQNIYKIHKNTYKYIKIHKQNTSKYKIKVHGEKI